MTSRAGAECTHERTGDGASALRSALAEAWRRLELGRPTDELADAVEAAISTAPGAPLAKADGTAGGGPRAEDSAAALLEDLESRTRSFFEDRPERPEQAAAGAALCRVHARLARRATLALTGEATLDEGPLLLAELAEIERSVGEDPFPSRAGGDDEGRSPLAAEIAARRARALAARGAALSSSLQSLAAAPPAPGDAGRAFTRLRELEAVRSEFRTCGADPETRASLDRAAGEASRVFDDKVRQAAARGDLESLASAARGVIIALDEARVRALDARGRAALADVQSLRRVAADFLPVFERALRDHGSRGEEDAARAGRRTARRLRRLQRRAGDVLADRVLHVRLERLFGRRLVRWWDAAIVWLILAVLGLLVIDHYRARPAAGVPWTVWADSAICSLLLADFFTRLALSPARFSYLRRRFLTELLPSLPFGLFEAVERLPEARVLRVLFVARLARLVILLRPLIRLLRLLLFVARACDRLVERHAGLLNQDIVFFTDPVKDEDVPSLAKRARELEAFVQREAADAVAQLPREARRLAFSLRARFVAGELDVLAGAVTPATPGDGPDERRAVAEHDVDDVIRTLHELSPARVAEVMGVEFAREVCESLRLLRLPLLRRLPVVRFVVGGDDDPDPLGVTARLGRVCGDVLQIAQRTITWFADLHGSITGAQFLDRLGNQLVRATAVPARRLVLFSAIVAAAMLLVQLTQLEFLDRFAQVLLRILSLPVLVLGLLCFVPLLLGAWFRRLAGQASDHFERVAEAKFLALTDCHKERRAAADLARLARAALLPEARLARAGPRSEPGGLEAGDDRAAGEEMVRRFVERALADPFGAARPPGDGSPRFAEAHAEKVLLYHRAHCDGGLLHKGDVALSNLLLGNLTLQDVRRERLRLDRKALRRLERLDLARGRGGLRGAQVWFRFITHTIAQRTARLVIEYNRNCMPLHGGDGATPADRERMAAWIESRRGILRLEREGRGAAAGEPKSARAPAPRRTDEFHALHFLVADPRRDEAVAERFGAAVATLLAEDRAQLIRGVFGTYPMGELPKERRTLNPYEAWRRWFSHGKVFLLPFTAAWLLLRAAGLLVRRVAAIVRDLLEPEASPLGVRSGFADFEVARRKIHRMRRPLVLEALRLRAAFDVEYLGLAVPGSPPPDALNPVAEDLRVLNASEREWEEFRVLKSRRRRQLEQLTALLERFGGPAQDAETRRAVATAFVCDQGGAASIAEALEVVERALRAGARTGPSSAPAVRLLRRLRRRRLREVALAAAEIVSRSGHGRAPGPLAEALLEAVARRPRELEPALRTLAALAGPAGVEASDPRRIAFERVAAVAAEKTRISEQLVAVRAAQALAMIDLEGYVETVAVLGAYDRRPPAVGAEDERGTT